MQSFVFQKDNKKIRCREFVRYNLKLCQKYDVTNSLNIYVLSLLELINHIYLLLIFSRETQIFI